MPASYWLGLPVVSFNLLSPKEPSKIFSLNPKGKTEDWSGSVGLRVNMELYSDSSTRPGANFACIYSPPFPSYQPVANL